MKTISAILSAAFVLMPWIVEPLLSQENIPSPQEKKVTITRRSVDADGSETTEIIVKKGKAAENFDLDKYLSENSSDNVQVDVLVEEGTEDEKTVILKRSPGNGAKYDHNYNYNYNYDYDYNYDYNRAEAPRSGKKAFLGVEEDSDEDADEPGLVVEVIRGSAADKAGLRHNDKILKLNDQKTNRWSDLTGFMRDAKPGDKVTITYSRNGKQYTTEALLTTRNDVKSEDKGPKGFFGVSDEDDNDEEPGVAVSITRNSGAEKAGLQDGDVIFQLNDTEIRDFEDISDFMAYTAPGDKIKVVFERAGKRNNVDVTLGEQKSWNWAEWNTGKIKLDDLDLNFRDKEACLGVYTGIGTRSEVRGAEITSFTTESAAREAQMQEGDLITAINGQRVQGHGELWNAIAKFKAGDKVSVEFLRDNQTNVIEVSLKGCRDNSGRVQLFDTDEGGDNSSRRFFIWNWSDDERQRLRERHVITIRRGAEGDAPKVNTAPGTEPVAADRKLNLQTFRAYPNPTQGQLTVEFRGEPVATIVSLFDLGGRQLFREELNAFSGDYSQQFDLSEYAKGTIIVHVLQGDKVYTEQVVIN